MSKIRNLFFSRRTIAFIEERPLAVLSAAIVYILLPIDFLPEALMGPLGAFDDILAGIAAIAVVKAAAKRRAANRPVAPPAQKPVPVKTNAPAVRPNENPRPQRDDRHRSRHRGHNRPRNNRPD